MLTEQYEKSIEQISQAIAISNEYSENEDQAIDRLLREAQAKNPSLLRAYFTEAATGKFHHAPTAEYSQDAREAATYKLALLKKATSRTSVRQDELGNKMLISLSRPKRQKISGSAYSASTSI